MNKSDLVDPWKDSDLINSTSVELENISNQIKWTKIEKKFEERIQDFLERLKIRSWKFCAKSIVAIVQSVMVMIIQSVYMVLIMLKIGDELSENIMPRVQKSGASQMNGIFFDWMTPINITS